MKISILLPYKENFSPEYPGAVSLFIKDTSNFSKYKKNLIVYGNTDFKEKFNINYVNIILKKKLSLVKQNNMLINLLNSKKKTNQILLKFTIGLIT